MNQIVTSTSNINGLHDYLVSNVDGFHRTTPGAYGLPTSSPDCGYVSGTDSEVTISFAFDLPAILIQTAINEFHNQ